MRMECDTCFSDKNLYITVTSSGKFIKESSQIRCFTCLSNDLSMRYLDGYWSNFNAIYDPRCPKTISEKFITYY
jgi:hypothetical protein